MAFGFRAAFLCPALLLLAGGAREQQADLAVSVAPAFVEPGVVSVIVANLSNEERCISMDAVADRQSRMIAAKLRIDGRWIPASEEGLIPPQVEGFHHLAPGEELSIQFDLRGRFWESLNRPWIRGKSWQVKIGVEHYTCTAAPKIGDFGIAWSKWSRMKGAGF